MARLLPFAALGFLLAACSAAPAATAAPLELPTAPAYRLQPGDLVLAASPDDIPAIFATPELFVDAAAGNAEWQDEEPVVGFAFNGEARAYPIRLLSLHEVVNDTIGGQPVAITWCPLCYSAIVFSRLVEGTELTFGVSGYLFKNNLVMYDHQSNTLWSQLLAQGLRGAHRGQALEILGVEHTTWGAWKTAHPATRVLSASQMDRNAAEIVDPYVAYYTSGAAGLSGPTSDDRLPPKTLVLGLRISDQQRAYPFETVRQLGLIQDELAGQPILLLYNPALNTVAVYLRRVDGQVLDFEAGEDAGRLQDGQTGSDWDAASGEALTGPLQGAHLDPQHATTVFWFAWSGIFPDTEIFVE